MDGHDGGLTRRCMRLSCRLPVESDVQRAAAVVEPPPAMDPTAIEHIAMRQETDQIICAMLDQDMETISDGSCRVITCLKGASHEQRKERLHTLVGHGFFKRSVNNYRGFATYIPMLNCKKGKEVLYPMGPVDSAVCFPERLCLAALQQYNDNPARKHNAITRETTFVAIANQNAAPGAGRWQVEHKSRWEEAMRQVGKLRSHPIAITGLLAKLEAEAQASNEPGAEYVTSSSSYRTKYDMRGRRTLNGFGLQSLPKTVQAQVIHGVVELNPIAYALADCCDRDSTTHGSHSQSGSWAPSLVPM